MSTDSVVARDGTTRPVGGQRWPSHSVLTQMVAGWHWVHLVCLGAPCYMVLLKISQNADEHDAVRALEWWLLSPGREDGDVIEVM